MRRNRVKYIIFATAMALSLSACGNVTADNDGSSVSATTNASAQTTSANDEKKENTTTANSGLAVVDTNKVTDILIQEYKADLTKDGKEESIKLCLSGQANDSLDKVEELVQENARTVKVQVYDGDTKLYEQEFTYAHAGNGQLSLVKKDDGYYLLYSSLWEGQGEGSYTYEVFDLKGTQKNVIDSYGVEFAIDESAVARAKAKGENIAWRNEVVPDFQSHIEKWFDESSDGCILLVSCDIGNVSSGGSKSVYVSNTATQYKPQDYYDGVWSRKDDL
jgi:hypothetical protein